MFLIPYAKLSDEQKSIIRQISRSTDDLFVSGPPGSGKTLISLYVLRDMAVEQAIKPLVLIFNHSLFSYLRSAMQELELSDRATIQTKDRFFWALAHNNQIDVSDFNNSRLSYKEKYEQVLNRLEKCSFEPIFDVTIIDEVQDTHLAELNLIRKISRRIVSLGDFQQRVYDSSLTEGDLTQKSTHFHLTKIFRFHKNIAKLAKSFARGNSTIDHQITRIEDAQVQLVDADNKEFQTIKEIVENLNSHSGRIGIICPNKNRLRELNEFFNRCGIANNYHDDNKDLRKLDMSSEIPLLLSSASSKGLEFEHVIVFGFDNFYGRLASLRREDKLNDLIYVSITRSNTNLYLVRGRNTIDEIASLSIQTEAPNIDINDLF